MLDPVPEPIPPAPPEDDLREALQRARAGDPTALPALREYLARPEVWRRYGDLAIHAQESWIGLISGADLALAEALRRRTEAMKDDLAGPSATPLERLLVGRIAVASLQADYEAALQAQAREMPLRQAEMGSRRQARAHKALLMAIATLATVRRLLPSPPGAAAPETIPGRPGRTAPQGELRERGTAGLEAAAPAPGEGRDEGPTDPAALTVFDRDDSPPKPDRRSGGRRPGRGRSAS